MSKGNRSERKVRSIRVYFSENEHADVLHTAQRMGLSPNQWVRAVAARNTEWSIMGHVDAALDRGAPLGGEPEVEVGEKAPTPPKTPLPLQPPRELDVHASPFGTPKPEPISAPPPKPVAIRPYPVDRSPLERKPAPAAPLARDAKPIESVRTQRRKMALRAEVRGRAEEPEVWLTEGRVFGGSHHGGFHQGDK